MREAESQWVDEELGVISVVRNARARNIIMRASTDGVRVTCSPRATLSEIRDALDAFRAKLSSRQTLIRDTATLIDRQFSISTGIVSVGFASDEECRSVKLHQGEVCVRRGEFWSKIYIEPGTDLTKYQGWLKKFFVEELRLHAKNYLPRRTDEIAAEYGFKHTGVKIQSSRTCWGSCSARNSINLSLYLMAVPSHLIDYVIKHELCHTVHHDHSDKFWKLMDDVTDGRTKDLRRELKEHRMPLG